MDEFAKQAQASIFAFGQFGGVPASVPIRRDHLVKMHDDIIHHAAEKAALAQTARMAADMATDMEWRLQHLTSARRFEADARWCMEQAQLIENWIG